MKVNGSKLEVAMVAVIILVLALVYHHYKFDNGTATPAPPATTHLAKEDSAVMRPIVRSVPVKAQPISWAKAESTNGTVLITAAVAVGHKTVAKGGTE